MKTCYIVGAGGSVPYGYPVGTQLVAEIAGYGLDIHAAGPWMTQPVLDLSRLSDLVKLGRPLSIDQYVKDQRSSGNGARLGVAISLLRREESYQSGLLHPEDWVRLLFEVHRENLLSSATPNFSVVTFNYDFEIEYHLLEMLSGYPEAVAGALSRLNQIPIVHVHGSLGRFPAKRRTYIPGESRMLNATISSHILQRASETAESLRFFWEHKQDSAESERARGLIREADRLVVVGVGQAAGPLQTLLDGRTDREVFVTCTKASIPQVRELRRALRATLSDDMTQWSICDCFRQWGLV